MNILMVTPYYFPAVGGLESYARAMACGLRDDHHQVTVATSGISWHERIDIVDGITVIRLPYMLRLSNTPLHLWWRWRLRRLIRELQPDIINAHLPVAFMADMAARAAGTTPFVLTYHNDIVKSGWFGNWAAKAYHHIWISRTLARADSIIVTSPLYAEQSAYLQPYRDKLHVVAPGVDTLRFNSRVDKHWLRRIYPLKQLVLFVGTVSTTHRHKGVGVLIRAMAQLRDELPQLGLVVAGDGNAIPEYRALAAACGLAKQIYFAGFVDDADLPKYYAGADICVLPSTSSAEGFGMVLTEAQACGTPVIGSQIGGVPFALRDGETGLLAEPGSAEALADQLRKLLGNDSLRVTYGEAASKLAAELSWPVQIAKAEAVLLDTIQRRRQPKVCVLHNVVSPYRLPLFEALNRSWRLHVLFSVGCPADRVWRYDLSRYRFDYQILHGVQLGPIRFNSGTWRALRRIRPDIVIVNSDPDTAPATLVVVLYARLYHKKLLVWSEVIDDHVQVYPSLVTARDPVRRKLHAVVNRMVLAYRQLVWSQADRFIAFSQAAATFLTSRSIEQQLISRTAQVMPPTLLPPCRKRRLKYSGCRFLYVGYLHERKAVHDLLTAFSMMPGKRLRLQIAGSGPTESALRNQAAADKRISFLGYLNDQAKADAYTAADVLVLPTASDCWGLVVNEAMHYGLAVICTKAAGAAELVDSHSGLVVPANNPEQLCAAMRKLADQPATLAAMQRHNLDRTDVTDIEAAAEGFRSAIRQLV